MPQMEGAADQIAAGWFAAEPAAERPGGLPRSGSSSRLNAQAPEFVPRGPPVPAPAPAVVVPPPPQVIRVFAAPPPPPRAAFFAAPPPPHRPFEYYAPVGGRCGFTAKEQHVPEPEPDVELLSPEAKAEPVVEGLDDEVVHKITKQVEYYFSDINLATTEHLMRFIAKDPEGYVPISVIAGFKKVKASVQNNAMLAAALRTSTKLVVNDDGKRVRRQEPFTESDLQELQSRIVVAENLPGDPSYQNLKKIFSAVGSVVSIRTCYPQTPNGTAPATNRSAKLDMLFANKLHAFVEYETPEDADKAILELNDEKNWRNGLRVRLLSTCTAKGAGKGKKGVYESDGNGEEDLSTSNQSNEKQFEESSQLIDVLPEHLAVGTLGEDRMDHRGRKKHEHSKIQCDALGLVRCPSRRAGPARHGPGTTASPCLGMARWSRHAVPWWHAGRRCCPGTARLALRGPCHAGGKTNAVAPCRARAIATLEYATVTDWCRRRRLKRIVVAVSDSSASPLSRTRERLPSPTQARHRLKRVTAAAVSSWKRRWRPE